MDGNEGGGHLDEVCGILVPRPGFKPTPSTLEGKVLTNGLPEKFQGCNSLQVHVGNKKNIRGKDHHHDPAPHSALFSPMSLELRPVGAVLRGRSASVTFSDFTTWGPHTWGGSNISLARLRL